MGQAYFVLAKIITIIIVIITITFTTTIIIRNF